MRVEVLKWTHDEGGSQSIHENDIRKDKLISETTDQSDGFYTGLAQHAGGSDMNITFNLPNEALEKQFLNEAKKAGFTGLNGHRSVGGCRASTYNAVPEATCVALSEFMQQFQHRNS